MYISPFSPQTTSKAATGSMVSSKTVPLDDWAWGIRDHVPNSMWNRLVAVTHTSWEGGGEGGRPPGSSPTSEFASWAPSWARSSFLQPLPSVKEATARHILSHGHKTNCHRPSEGIRRVHPLRLPQTARCTLSTPKVPEPSRTAPTPLPRTPAQHTNTKNASTYEIKIIESENISFRKAPSWLPVRTRMQEPSVISVDQLKAITARADPSFVAQYTRVVSLPRSHTRPLCACRLMGGEAPV